jgi:hypothetical protein
MQEIRRTKQSSWVAGIKGRVAARENLVSLALEVSYMGPPGLENFVL